MYFFVALQKCIGYNQVVSCYWQLFDAFIAERSCYE